MNRVLKKAPLHPHPDMSQPEIHIGTYCSVTPTGKARIGYALVGAVDLVDLPPRADKPERRDGLWRHTCFEAFFRIDGEEGYRELNFAPSGDWAAYRFARYRDGMAIDGSIGQPGLSIEINEFGLVYWYEFTAGWLTDPRAFAVGLSAVIVEVDGRTGYWAIRHPEGPPDFHHADCFARTLAAPDAA